MHDIRLHRWAHTLVHYSLALKAGEILAIEATPAAAPLIEAVYREALHIGAHPVPFLNLETLDELLFQGGNDQQLNWLSPMHQTMAERVDARLFIHSSENTCGLSGIDPTRAARRKQALQSIYATFRQREQSEGFRWCLTLYPTQAYAQNARMSLSAFEEFVCEACLLNDPDPIARWQELEAQQQRLIEWLQGHDRVHILGEGTDLTLSIKGRRVMSDGGTRNFPGGEVFTGPVETSANGVIRFLPSTFDERVVEGIRLVFQDGKVVEASANQQEAYLLGMLDLDEGARFLGEFAFGNNRGITHTTRHILFDEKMGGTIHLALGNSLPGTGGLNRSAIHWDMICDVRTAGEVWVDETLFLKDGQILV
ncbi:aminopeptidase [Dictyobacter formicarum]|uniref:Aminopeptidase n=1 Tax=Dictyobacter formicarum TaxID=2778368 RepID=A0ABQ3VHK5_9CHLR|nr:aminopeptidase [Dictyobacter formicarum]GHO85662.1 aminopeptidase [Dictyobacter formicarum]